MVQGSRPPRFSGTNHPSFSRVQSPESRPPHNANQANQLTEQATQLPTTRAERAKPKARKPSSLKDPSRGARKQTPPTGRRRGPRQGQRKQHHSGAAGLSQPSTGARGFRNTLRICGIRGGISRDLLVSGETMVGFAGKRKELEQVMDGLSDFSLSGPAAKSRRLVSY